MDGMHSKEERRSKEIRRGVVFTIESIPFILSTQPTTTHTAITTCAPTFIAATSAVVGLYGPEPANPARTINRPGEKQQCPGDYTTEAATM